MRAIKLSLVLCAALAAPFASHAATDGAATLTSAFDGTAMPDSAMNDERGGGVSIFGAVPTGSTTRIDINNTSSGTNNQPGNPSHSKTVLAVGGTTATTESSLSSGGPVTNRNVGSSLSFNSSVSSTHSFGYSHITGQ